MLAGTPGDFPIGRGVTRLILEEDGNTAMFPVAVSFTVMSFNQYYPVTIILQCYITPVTLGSVGLCCLGNR